MPAIAEILPVVLTWWTTYAHGALGCAVVFVAWVRERRKRATHTTYPQTSCGRCGYWIEGFSECPECGLDPLTPVLAIPMSRKATFRVLGVALIPMSVSLLVFTDLPFFYCVRNIALVGAMYLLVLMPASIGWQLLHGLVVLEAAPARRLALGLALATSTWWAVFTGIVYQLAKLSLGV